MSALGHLRKFRRHMDGRLQHGDVGGVFLCLFRKRGAEDGIHGFLCVGGGMNDEAVILFQLGNPVLDVGGGVAVGVLVGNARDGAEKGRAHLGYQFLFAVKLISEVVAKGAIQAAFVAGAVDQFVKQGAVVVRRIHEAGTGGHVDGIGAWPVVSAVLGGAGQMEGGAVLPSGNDGFAESRPRRSPGAVAGCSRSAGSVRPSHCSTLKTV